MWLLFASFGYRYLGCGNNLYNGKYKNYLDYCALLHDLAYKYCETKQEIIHSDKEFVKKILLGTNCDCAQTILIYICLICMLIKIALYEYCNVFIYPSQIGCLESKNILKLQKITRLFEL